MKKSTLFISCFFTAAAAFAQNIPNTGFETWVNNNESPATYLVPQGWITQDVVESVFATAFGDSTYVANSVTRVTGHNGQYAAQMTSVISNQGDTLPGVIYSMTSAQDFFSYAFGGIMEGFASSTRPANLVGYYKANIVGGDTVGIGVLMTKWNTNTNSRDILVSVSTGFHANASGWTAFSIPLSYAMSENPDSVLIIAGMGTNPGSAQNAGTHPGTSFTIDDLAFTGNVPMGVQEQTNAVSVMLFPNPFSEQATMKISNLSIDHASLEIYDVLGNKVRTINDLSGNTISISREGLSSGLYFYNLINDNAIIATGKFSVE